MSRNTSVPAHEAAGECSSAQEGSYQIKRAPELINRTSEETLIALTSTKDRNSSKN